MKLEVEDNHESKKKYLLFRKLEVEDNHQSKKNYLLFRKLEVDFKKIFLDRLKSSKH